MLQIKRVPEKSARKQARPITGKPQTEKVYISSPTVPGAQEQVEAVIDTIDYMRERRQIDARQYDAAEKLRRAWDQVWGSIGGVMDPDRVRGGGMPGAPPPKSRMEAAEVLNTAKFKLYPRDYAVVERVVCKGYRIDETAGQIFRVTKPSGMQKREVGRRLRDGLSELASLWYSGDRGNERERTVDPFHAPDADPRSKPYTATAGTLDAPGNTAHWNGRKVIRR